FTPGLIKPIWTHGFFGVDVDSGFTVTLAPAESPTKEPALPVLRSPGPITIPDAEAEEIFEEYYPQLRASADVVSTDDSVTFRAYGRPRLVVFLSFVTGERLVVSWNVGFSAPRRSYPVNTRRQFSAASAADYAQLGDLEHEDAVVTEVEKRLAETHETGSAL